ncbi:hypothetical protein RFI_24644, partial [Reticulomyxa filosa]
MYVYVYVYDALHGTNIKNRHLSEIYSIGGTVDNKNNNNTPPPRVLHSVTRLNEHSLLLYGGIAYPKWQINQSQSSSKTSDSDQAEDVKKEKENHTDNISSSSNPSMLAAESVHELWNELQERVEGPHTTNAKAKKEEVIVYNDMWILDLKKKQWVPKENHWETMAGRYDHSSVLMADGKSVMMIGGKRFPCENNKNRYDSFIDHNHWDLQYSPDYSDNFKQLKDFLGSNTIADAIEHVSLFFFCVCMCYLLRDEGTGESSIVHVYDLEQDMWYTPTHTGQVPPYEFLMNHSCVVYDNPSKSQKQHYQQRLFLFPEHTSIMYVLTPQSCKHPSRSTILARNYQLHWQRVSITLPNTRVLCKPLVGFVNNHRQLTVLARTNTLQQIALLIDPHTMQLLQITNLNNGIFDHYKLSPGRVLTEYKYFHCNLNGIENQSQHNYDVVLYHGGIWLDQLEWMLLHEGVMDTNGDTLKQILTNVNSRSIMLAITTPFESQSQHQPSKQDLTKKQWFWLGNEVRSPDLGLPPLFGHSIINVGDQLV